jgi:hypothetical protein
VTVRMEVRVRKGGSGDEENELAVE